MTLDDLERLLDAATPGPWRWSDWSATFGTVENRSLMSTLTGNDPRPPEPQPAIRGRWAGTPVAQLEEPIENAADYKLIVAAVNALPALIAVASAADALLSDDTHNGDANCMAGDCDGCAVHDREAALRTALAALEKP